MKHSTLGVSDFQYLKAFRALLPARLLRQAVAATTRGRRRDRLLPAHLLLGCLVAWFCRAKDKLPAVAAWLCRRPAGLPSDSALYQARARLGWAPVRWLCRRVLRPLAEPARDPSAFYAGLRLLGLDGTTFTAADSPANARCFGRAGNQHKPSGYPLLRCVALCALGTHALLRWLTRAFRVSAQALAARLWRHVPAGSLLLCDRNFHCYPLWRAATAGGWDLLLRVQAGPKFVADEALPDGSWLARVYPRRGKGKKGRALRVRVVAYAWADERGRRHAARLLSSLLDWRAHPAAALVELYHRRWEQEGVFREVKAALLGRAAQVRARDPLVALQELDGLLLGHFVVRWVILRAARRQGVPPVAVSFAGALRVLQGRLGPRRGALEEAVGRERLQKRRRRSCPRKKKVTRSAWPAKGAGDGETPVPALVVVPLSSG
jgi:hypothetical protein